MPNYLFLALVLGFASMNAHEIEQEAAPTLSHGHGNPFSLGPLADQQTATVAEPSEE